MCVPSAETMHKYDVTLTIISLSTLVDYSLITNYAAEKYCRALMKIKRRILLQGKKGYLLGQFTQIANKHIFSIKPTGIHAVTDST